MGEFRKGAILKKREPKYNLYEYSEDLKDDYTRLFPSKVSSKNFITTYILFMLDRYNKPMYGKEILEYLKKNIDTPNIWKPSHGTLYPALAKLEKEGLIENNYVEHKKIYYSITTQGRKALYENMEEFKLMLISSNKFFTNVINDMYLGISRNRF